MQSDVSIRSESLPPWYPLQVSSRYTVQFYSSSSYMYIGYKYHGWCDACAAAIKYISSTRVYVRTVRYCTYSTVCALRVVSAGNARAENYSTVRYNTPWCTEIISFITGGVRSRICMMSSIDFQCQNGCR